MAIIVGSELTAEGDFEICQEWDFEFVPTAPPGRLRRRAALSKLQAQPFILYRKGSVMENHVDCYFAGHRDAARRCRSDQGDD